MPHFLTDPSIAWQSEMFFNVFEIEHYKNATLETVFMEDIATFSSIHLLQSLDNQIWRDALKVDKLSFLNVDFRSLAEKPKQD